MTTYNPHSWVMLHMKTETEEFHRVFAGWYGGFARGDSWKMNSGVQQIKEDAEFYDVLGVSGSIYQLPKVCEKMSAYQMSVLNDFQARYESKATIVVVPMTSLLERYK